MPRQISPKELSARLASGSPTHLLDVRQKWEHDLVALPGSVLIPLDQLAAVVDQIRPSPGAVVVTYCHHGVRSWEAAELLEAAGLTEVHSLAGGIDAWSLQVDPKLPRY